MKINLQMFGGRGASSGGSSNVNINFSYNAPIMGMGLNIEQQKEIQNKAKNYVNTLNLKDGDVTINAESYAYQDQVDVLVLPSTKKGTKGGTMQEARYQERARIQIRDTTEEKKLLKKGFKKYQFGNYLSYEKIIYGKKIS